LSQTIKSISKAASLTALGNMTSRLSGLIRDLLYSYFWGTSAAISSFLVAFMVPNLFRRVFGDGALSNAFIPKFTDKVKLGNHKASDFASNILSVTFIALAVFCTVIALCCLLASYFTTGRYRLIFQLLSFMIPYALLICLTCLICGVLNVYKEFFLPSMMSVVLNICLIFFTLCSGLFLAGNAEQQVWCVAAGVLCGGVLQLAIVYFSLKKKGIFLKWKPDFKNPELSAVWKLFLPGMFAAMLFQLNTLADKFIGTWIGDDAVASLYYSERLTYLPVGVFGVAMGVACLPAMAKAAAVKDSVKLSESLAFGLKTICFLTFPCAIAMFLYHQPILIMVFQRGVEF